MARHSSAQIVSPNSSGVPQLHTHQSFGAGNVTTHQTNVLDVWWVQRSKQCPRALQQSEEGHQMVSAILKIGKYMPITIPPTNTPKITMMNGSNRLDKESTALATSSS